MKQRYKQKSAAVEAILLSQGDTFKVWHEGGKEISFVPKEKFLAAYELAEKESVVAEVKEEAEGEKPSGRKFKQV